jgi:hypothetical protein
MPRHDRGIRACVLVAALNNQPQGGFVTRQPSHNVWGDDGSGPFFQRNWDSQSGNTRRRGGQGWW